MLRALRIFFHNNKVKIIRNVLIVALVIIIIQFMNHLTAKEAVMNNKISIKNEFSYGNLINFNNSTGNVTSKPNENVMKNEIVNEIDGNNTTTGENIIGGNSLGSGNNVGGIVNNDNNTSGDMKPNNQEQIIEYFLDLCIEGKCEEAYDMLSEECKKVLFPTIEKFKKNYCSRIFTKDKMYIMEKYYGNTYKVKIADDMSMTGIYTPIASTEYITVNSQNKLNINNYIGRFNINSTSTPNDIIATVNYKDVFMDYERYNITVNNGYSKTVLLNANSSKNTMYITDKNDNKYYAHIHEISENSMILRSGSKIDFNIKYTVSYSELNAEKYLLVFSGIILDYDSYRNTENVEDYKNFGMINVRI